jgi:hypothetical protein
LENSIEQTKPKRTNPASAINGLKGGRPVSPTTLRTQKMREVLTLAVYENFKEIYEPQIKKAKEGDLGAFKELLDRSGVKSEDSDKNNVFVPIQIVIRDEHNN